MVNRSVTRAVLALLLLIGVACGQNQTVAESGRIQAAADGAETTTTATAPSTTTATSNLAMMTAWADQFIKVAGVIEASRRLTDIFISVGPRDPGDCKGLIKEVQQNKDALVLIAPDEAVASTARNYFEDVLLDATLCVSVDPDDDVFLKLVLGELEQRGVNLEPLGASTTFGLGR